MLMVSALVNASLVGLGKPVRHLSAPMQTITSLVVEIYVVRKKRALMVDVCASASPAGLVKHVRPLCVHTLISTQVARRSCVLVMVSLSSLQMGNRVTASANMIGCNQIARGHPARQTRRARSAVATGRLWTQRGDAPVTANQAGKVKTAMNLCARIPQRMAHA
jgi:hypothetical protein